MLERLSLVSKLLPERRRPRRSVLTRPASATSSGTRSRARRIRCAICAASRTGSSATSSTPCLAWPRSRRSAATSSSTRSTSIPIGCAAYSLTLGEVVRAVRKSNANVGGNVLESNGTWSIVRGVGLVAVGRTTSRSIVVGAANGVPVYVRPGGDGAASATPSASRRSSRASSEAVGGVVVARSGRKRAAGDRRASRRGSRRSSRGCPTGVRIVPFYDRSELIEQAIDTLRAALIEEILLVTLAHIVFLMHFRSILDRHAAAAAGRADRRSWRCTTPASRRTS